ncbi:MAG: PKD repeat protein [Gammaproteobacteria bacterium]
MALFICAPFSLFPHDKTNEMPTLKLNSLLFVLLLLANGLLGQASHSENTLQLRSSLVLLPANAETYFNQEIPPTKAHYRYVHFFKIPDATELADLQKEGIHLLQYLSNRTYIAAIDTKGRFSKQLQDNIRSVVDIKANDKIAPKLLAQYHTAEPFGKKQKITFLLQYYSDFPTTEILVLLQKQNIRILEQQVPIQAITVSASKDQLMDIASWPMIANLEDLSIDVHPEDEHGRSHHRSNLINSSWDSDLHFNGEGVHIAIGDDGFIGPHIDLKNRTVQADLIGDKVGDHGEMVAGILAGAGNLNSDNKGIADGATLHVLRDFEAVIKGAVLFEEEGVVITNTAYSDGCNRGYTTLAQLADQQSDLIPELIHVFSAGNAGVDDCEYGAGNGWGNITGGVKTGKNVLAVANLNVNGERVSSSSRGPSNDGRIKPDIAAFGEGQMSLLPNNEYQIGSGTSAAAPVVSGVLAQLYQAYREKYNNTNPSSALLKACLLNSADDLGNPGPDYSFGWGKVNAYQAFKIIDEEQWLTGTATQSSEETFSISIPANVKELRVMLYWHDKAASPTSAKSLVHDIDLNVETPDGVIHLPWVLNNNPSADLLDSPAGIGADHLNNMEQVFISNPAAGNYDFHVNGFEIPFTEQEYYIVYSYAFDELKLTFPNGGESFAPTDQIQIHWEALGSSSEFKLEYSSNNGNSWNPLTILPGHLRQFLWTVPDLQSGEVVVRVNRENQVASSEQVFSIYQTPSGFSVSKVCPTFVQLSWDALDAAATYTIYQLGERYMDSIATTSNTSIDIPISDPTKKQWFAISAEAVNGAKGKRNLAIQTEGEILNCTPVKDMALTAIVNPSSSNVSDCFSQEMPIRINLTNTGSETQSNIPVYYQYNNEPVVSGIFSGSLPPDVTVNYNFPTAIITNGLGIHTLKVWTGFPLDEATYNDTLAFQFEVVESTINELPFFENFDDFELCSTDASCAVTCLLQNDWQNTENSRDGIDWRVHRERTPTFGTGPDTDQNTRTEVGQYLYLEAGAGCFAQNAILTSPCIDLNNAVTPTLTFWYHMYGLSMGSLQIDLFDGEQWHFNISNAIVGDQGDQWRKSTIDLSPFANNLITLRFRGKTGGGFFTDLAIDNLSVYDANTPPVADFIVNKRQGCSDEVIRFIDNSINEGTSWNWDFEPSTVSFVENTNAQSQHPVVQFSETGLYSVTLSTGNSFGTTDLQRADYILISDGVPLPYIQDFDGISFPPQNWQLENTDNNISWVTSEVIGKNGAFSKAAFMNNFSYNKSDEDDVLTAPIVNLKNSISPLLRFDYSYVSYSNKFSDQLEVILSTDCGNSFTIPLFEKSGNDLATAENQKMAWTPQGSIDWETVIIDLGDYIGQSISIRFVNTCQFGNNLYLDNIAVYENGAFPVTSFNIESADISICVGDSLTFSNTTFGNDGGTYFWNFGNNNIPPNANTEGAHTVSFPETGQQSITLIATNDLGTDVKTSHIEVIDIPIVDFEIAPNGLEVQFDNNSIYGATYLWDFGDGQNSNAVNPMHTFASSGSYEVTLTVSNSCGTTEHSQMLVLSNSHSPPSFELSVFPNPAENWFVLKTNNNVNVEMNYQILSVSGQLVSEAILSVSSGEQSQVVDIRGLAAGVYFLRFEVGFFVGARKLVVF